MTALTLSAAARRSFSDAAVTSRTTRSASPTLTASISSDARLIQRVLGAARARPRGCACTGRARHDASRTTGRCSAHRRGSAPGIDSSLRTSPVAVETHRALLDELRGAEEARVHPLEHRAVVRQLSVEERARAEVVADAPGRAERGVCVCASAWCRVQTRATRGRSQARRATHPRPRRRPRRRRPRAR